jgi:hypothetical protein
MPRQVCRLTYLLRQRMKMAMPTIAAAPSTEPTAIPTISAWDRPEGVALLALEDEGSCRKWRGKSNYKKSEGRGGGGCGWEGEGAQCERVVS